MSERKRLPTDRHGQTSKSKIGKSSIYITVNRNEEGEILECFGKADDGHTSDIEGLCILTSIALQFGAPVQTIVDKLRYRRYEPSGGPGQPLSISDALARVLEEESKDEG